MENIYISWHYTTHGIAYFKHILSAFYCGKCRVTDKKINSSVCQDEMNTVFDWYDDGFLFDKVYFLTAPQESFDELSTRRFYYRKNILEDAEIIKNNLLEVWKDILNADREGENWGIKQELEYVKEKYPKRYADFEKLIWRDMQHYDIASQLYWFKELSNASEMYENRFEEKYFDIKSLRNPQEIVSQTSRWITRLTEKHPNAQFFINVALGSNETQVVWHILSESNLLPLNTKLLYTYDNKLDGRQKLFKKILIKEVPTKLISTVKQSIQLYDKPVSNKRKLAELKFKNYLELGFAILILGERGIGKSRLVENNKGKGNFVEVNCASFDDDNKAEAELFGYKKGAFTGADSDKNGLFYEANNGILFLDEFHHLSKILQAKLMKALQTDENNNMTIRPLGSSKTFKVNCRVIMASNKSIDKLKECTLADFYERISQLVIELPPLRETPEDRVNDWKASWKQLKFYAHPLLSVKDAPDDDLLIEWLQSLKLPGNFRDLQKIAISYFGYLTFGPEIKALLPEKSPLEYAQAEFRKYHAPNHPTFESTFFSIDKTPAEMMREFKRKFAEWAINKHHGAPNAEKHFKKQGDKTTVTTLYKWRNNI